MRKVYISSTYEDLRDYRQTVATALRKIRYDVLRMEENVARDERTRAACEADVRACDVYIGLFAWRYGHVPTGDNEEARSITELEYRTALGSGRITCLVFLLSDDAAWPSTKRDAETGEGEGGARIRELRAELKGRCSGYFSTPDQLATEVIAAVHQDESTKRIDRLNVVDEIKQSVGLGPSYLPNIQQKIVESQSAEIVEISLGPTPWWTTRLHLVAALATDFTTIRQFIFLDREGHYLSMTSPLELRRGLTSRFPMLERAYLQSRCAVETGDGAMTELDQIIMRYPEQIFHLFASRPEQDVKVDVSPVMVLRDLGLEPSAEVVERGPESLSRQRWEILRRKTPFVVVLDHGNIVSVIDRVQLAGRIAVEAVAERG